MSERHPPGEPVPIPLLQLIPNPDYQPRAGGLSEAHVRLLLEAGPDSWRPLLVSPADNGRFDVIDGFHRYEAARRLGLAALACLVQPDAGYPEAVAANLRHGLPLSLADRKDFARWLAANEHGLSYREIGRRCGLSDKTAKDAVERRHADSARRPSGSVRPKRLNDLCAVVDFLFDAGPNGDAADDVRFLIEDYHEDDRTAVAESLAGWGWVLLSAAEPYVHDDSTANAADK